MDVQERNGIKTYEISTSGLLPEWFNAKQRREANKQSTNYVRRRIELLQGFDFPISSRKLQQTLDGKYILGIGTYKPRMKCYDLYECGMKFERYTNAETIDIITSIGCYDWKKFILLDSQRTLNFHAPYGIHYNMRLPTFCTSMIYQEYNCNLCVASSNTNDIYRLDLEEGRFIQPLVTFPNTDKNVVGNCMDNSPTHRLLGVGCSDGTIKFYDGRNKNTIVKSFVSTKAFNVDGRYHVDEQVTSMAFSKSGIELVSGSSNGNVNVYDMRSSIPLHTIKHSHSLPIHTTRFHSNKTIISVDSKIIKLSNTSTNKLITNIESSNSSAINHCLVAGDEYDPTGDKSGLLLCAGESTNIQSYFVPALGKAPQWCSYLDNITEELEERNAGPLSTTNTEETTMNTETIYQDYKFLTNVDLEKLGVTNLIGTSYLRGYMHGYFIDQSLYNKIKSITNNGEPFEYDSYRKKLIQNKLQEKVKSRISALTITSIHNNNTNTDQKIKTAKINQSLQQKLINKSNNKADKISKTLLQDDRFTSKLFDNVDFEIDEYCDDYKLRHPSATADQNTDSDAKKKKMMDHEELDDYDSDNNINMNNSNSMHGFQKIQANNESDDSVNNEDDDIYYSTDDDNEDGFSRAKVRGENYKQVKKLIKIKQQKPTMYEATDDITQEQALTIGLLGAQRNNKDDEELHKQKYITKENISLNDRMQTQKMDMQSNRMKTIKSKSGRKEVMYVPKEKKRRNANGKRRHSST